MTEKELKKLSRADLLQILIAQGRELREMQEKYAQAERALQERTIRLNKAGSIAEASLQLNGVFEAAQAACEQYQESILELSRRQYAACAKIEEESKKKAELLLKETEKECRIRKEETERQCEEMLEKARAEVLKL